MSDGCRAFERRRTQVASPDRASQAVWADHVRVCASCREQDAADRALRSLFAGARRPALPPFFAERCASRARLTPSARPLSAKQRAVMQAYWALTVVVCGVVLARTDWPTVTLTTMPPVVAAGAVVTVAAVLTPILLLAHLRGGLSTLVRRMLA